jgi:hypothetical protein
MSDVKKVEWAAAKAALAREKLELAMRAAHENGVALRKIAAAAGVSHEQVRRVLAR